MSINSKRKRDARKRARSVREQPPRRKGPTMLPREALPDLDNYEVIDVYNSWDYLRPFYNDPVVRAKMEEMLPRNVGPLLEPLYPSNWSVDKALTGEHPPPLVMMDASFSDDKHDEEQRAALTFMLAVCRDAFATPEHPGWWYPFRGCHAAASHCLLLADRAYPDGEWFVLTGALHSTLIDPRKKRVLELMPYKDYWACTRRVFGNALMADLTPQMWATADPRDYGASEAVARGLEQSFFNRTGHPLVAQG